MTADQQRIDDLDENISALQTEVMGALGSSDDTRYHELVKDLSVLYKLKLEETDRQLTRLEAENKMRLNPNSVLQAGTNLAGILLILNYEQLHAATSKAFGFIGKSKP